jgi:hypothetical protein
MAKKKSLDDRAYEKVQREFDAFIADIKTKSPNEIVNAAYEIVYKEEILSMFEIDGAFNDKQSLAILKTKNALDYLYNEWLDYDGSVIDTLKDCVENSLNVRFEHIKAKQIAEKDCR